jgi:hypothetical protein
MSCPVCDTHPHGRVSTIPPPAFFQHMQVNGGRLRRTIRVVGRDLLELRVSEALPLAVIASEAKQSKGGTACTAGWIASSLRFSQ